MSARLQPGDRVKCVDVVGARGLLTKGQEYTVIEDRPFWGVQVDCGWRTWWNTYRFDTSETSTTIQGGNDVDKRLAAARPGGQAMSKMNAARLAYEVARAAAKRDPEVEAFRKAAAAFTADATVSKKAARKALRYRARRQKAAPEDKP